MNPPKQPGSVREAIDAGERAAPEVKPVGVELGDAFVPPTDRKPKPFEEEAAPTIDESLPKWTETDVRAALKGVTVSAHGVAGERVGANLVMTPDELDQIAPPLTNIINRTPALRAAASASDAVRLGLGMLGYAMRVGGESAATAKERKRQAAKQAEREAFGGEIVEFPTGGRDSD